MLKFAQIVIAGIAEGSVYALIALGFAIVYRVTQSVNLAQGAYCVLAALLGMSFGVLGGWFAGQLALAVMAATAFGVLVGALTLVPALRTLPQSGVFMVSAGLLTAVNGAILIVWGNEPFVLREFFGEEPLRLFGVSISTQSLWIIGTSLAAIIGVRWLLYGTSLGRALRACAENRTAAQLVGINLNRMILLAFGMSSFIAGCGGVVMAPAVSFQFDTGNALTIAGFIAATVGGFHSFWGVVVGGIMLGLTKQLGAGYFSSIIAESLPLVILLAVLLTRPTGLLATASRRLDVRDTHQSHKATARLRPRQSLVLATLALGLAIFGAYPLLDTGFSSSLVIAVIIAISLVGLDVLMGFTGQISLGHAGFMAIGGYSAAYFVTNGLDSLSAIVIGMVMSAVVALLLASITANLRGIYLALATMSFGLLVDAVAVNAVELTGGPAGFVGIPNLSIAGFVFSSSRSMYYLSLTVLVVVVLLLFGALRSDFGRALQSIRTDPMAAAALGIDVSKYRTLAFVISALLGSLSGSLYAFTFQFLSPDMVSTARSFELVAMLVLGGEGTLIGGLIGSVILTVLPTVFQPLAEYKTLITGVLLIVMFRFFPGGILGAIYNALAHISGPGTVVDDVRPKASHP